MRRDGRFDGAADAADLGKFAVGELVDGKQQQVIDPEMIRQRFPDPAHFLQELLELACFLHGQEVADPIRRYEKWLGFDAADLCSFDDVVGELRQITELDLVDGKDLFWYGTHMARAIERLSEEVARTRARCFGLASHN